MWPTPILIGCAVLFSLNMWIGYRQPVFLGLSIFVWLLISAELLRVLTTRLTGEGFSQNTLRGRKYIAWADVEQVSLRDGRYWVSGRGLKLVLRPGLFEDPEAARAFIEKQLPAEQMKLAQPPADQADESTSLWVPGKFIPKPDDGLMRLWIRFSPLGWEGLPYAGVFVPGMFLEYAMYSGHGIIAAVGSLVWAPILWLLLVTFHQAGRVRIWVSLPGVLFVHLFVALLLVGAF